MAITLLSVVVLIVVLSVADGPHKIAAAAPAHKAIVNRQSKAAAESQSTGLILRVDTGGCAVTEFDNSSGQFGMQRPVPCPRGSDGDGHQMPLNRFKRFNRGFQK
ncbi:MAG TPA: hypothetical protein VE224_10655 [Pseudolabrys sp.]|nr:hypothetical protein [Pseudolabrys sp.]